MTPLPPHLAAAQRILAAGAERRRGLLVSSFPLIVLETTPGSGASDLLRDWAAMPETTDLRVLLEADKLSATGGQLLAAIVRLVRAEGEQAAAGQAEGGQAAVGDQGADHPADWASEASPADLSRAVTALRRPLSVAVLRADFLPVEVFRELLTAFSQHDAVQLIVAGFDCQALVDEARAARTPFRQVTDEDLVLSSDEIAARLTWAGLDDGPATAGRLRYRTGGLALALEAAINLLRDRADGSTDAHGEPLAGGEVGGYLFTTGVQHWPSPLVAFVSTMAHVPRFTADEANAIAETASARVFIDRMCALGLGRLAFHPALRQRVFTWFETARATSLAYIRRYETVEADQERRLRTASAALEASDTDLYLASLVSLGRFAEAERYLVDWMWDCLPNGFSPVWEDMEAFGPLEFVDYPRLVALRIRVEPRRDSLAAKRALAHAAGLVSDAASAAGGPDVWHRLGMLALGMEFARVTRQTAELPDLLGRAAELVAGVTSGALFASITRGAVSDLLLIAEVGLRLGNLTVAALFARYAMDFIDADPGVLDPWRERRAFAARVILAADRERGSVDSVDAATVLAAPQFRWRDADLIAHTIAKVWADFDAGALAVGAERCTEALQRVAPLSEWPLMWFHQLWLAGLMGQQDRLFTLRERYVASLAAAGMDIATMPDRTPEVLRRMSHVTGGYVPSPNFVPLAEGVKGGDGMPRWQFGLVLLQALDALRADRRGEAHALLARALSVVYERPIGPMSLVVASVDEIRELAGLIADHPWAPLLNLDYAIATAGQISGADGVGLSDREEQVLSLLRLGMTNQQIAEELFVSVNTVKFHRGNLMRKLGASSRQELLEAAARLGL